ncbi:MAG: type II toxin-antitoxin system PemK/MazF family toxin [candidate division NC10 bacterium]|nr:type II toxin-antitoxin system PemK/MazF family toxin [candidate division NC10 bacterium]
MEVKKWHVYLADLNPKIGTEPGKVRPVVVVQTDLLNSTHPSTIICPITTNVQPEAQVLRVHLRKGEAGLKQRSDVMVDQLRAIDNRRLIRQLGKISRRSQENLARSIRIVLE